MSKRTTSFRNSPPSPSPLHKKRKMEEDTPMMLSATASTESLTGTSSSDILSILKGTKTLSYGVTLLTPPTGQVSTGWTKVEKRKEKKAKKSAEKAVNLPPSFAFNVQELNRMKTVSITDIRELALHLTGQAQPPKWLRVTNRTSIQHTVVLLIPGITRDIYDPPLQPQTGTGGVLLHVPSISSSNAPGAATSKLPYLSNFMNAVPTKAPGDSHRMFSVLHGFFMGPVTGEEKKRRIAGRIKDERESLNSMNSYLLSPEQLIENEYPVPTWMAEVSQLGEDWLQTPQCPENELGQVLALDCEMCITTSGKELTHICIIDYKTGEKLYDELVLPSAPVVDYLTRFSGIAPSSLDGVETTLADVHAFLAKLITPSTILLGHSLESDLRAMKLAHGRCLDTSVLYHHPRGRPLKPGLKWLMKKWANKDIQTRGEGGHDPEEDARACVDLMKLKLRNGKSFGLFMTDTENILERLSRDGRGVKTAVVDYGKPSTWLGAKATSTVACTSDEDVVKGVKEMVSSHQFVFGRLLELSEGLGWTAKKNTTSQVANTPMETPMQELNAALEPPVSAVQTKTLDELYGSLNANLVEIYNALPPSTALILMSGHGDPRRMSELSTKKSNFETAVREGKETADIPKEEWWSTQDARLLEDEVEKAKYGLLFLGIK